MGKNKKNKKRKKLKNIPNKNLSFHEIEKIAIASFNKANYIDSLNHFKMLPHENRKQHRDLLIKCYINVIDIYMEKEDLAKAEANIEQCTKFIGEDCCLFQQLQLSLKKNNFEKAVYFANKILLQPSEKLIEISQKEVSNIADILIISFEDANLINTYSSQLYKDICAIQKSLTQISQENYDDAKAAIKNISYNSMISYWKLFIKGLCAFYCGNNEIAIKALEKIPQGTFVYNAAKTYLDTLNYNKTLAVSYKNVQLLKNICFMLGHSNIQNILARLEYLWRSGRKKDSYLYLREQIKTFPVVESGYLNDLSFFIFNSFLELGYERCNRFLHNLSKLRYKNDFEQYLSFRSKMILCDIDGEYSEIAKDIFETMYKLYRKLYGNNSIAESQIYLAAARHFSFIEQDPMDMGFGFFMPKRYNKKTVHNEKEAKLYYARAKKIAPEDKEICLQEVELYENLNDKSKINKLLDTIIQKFPNDKDSLFKAGIRCIERKAYNKGIDYLEKAKLLDPLDPKLKEALCIGYIKLGLKYACKQKDSNFRSLLPKVLKCSKAESINLTTGHAFLFIRWAAFEFLCGNNEKAEELIKKSQSQSQNQDYITLLYFTLIIFKEYLVLPNIIKRFEKLFKNAIKKYSIQIATSLKNVLIYLSKFQSYKIGTEAKMFEKYITKVNDIELEPQKTREIIEYLMAFPEEYPSGYKIVKSWSLRMLKINKDDPFFRYSLWVTENSRNPLLIKPEEADKLEEMLEDAQKNNDSTLINNIEKSLEAIDKVHKIYNIMHSKSPFDDDEYYDDDDEYYDDDDEYYDDDDEYYDEDDEYYDYDPKSIDPVAINNLIDIFINQSKKGKRK